MTVLSSQDADTYFENIKERALFYRNSGYSILLAPDPEQLPDFLKEFPIHLVAKNGIENVVVEVRTLNSLKDDPYIQKLAEVIQERRPDWRFELVMVKDKPVPPVAVDLKALLEEVETLQNLGYSNAAFLLVWSALEIGLRKLATKEEVPLEKDAADFVVGKLASFGWIEDDTYNVLRDALETREAVSHGYKVSEDLAVLTEKLLAIARTLV
jgi:hypothetical protein